MATENATMSLENLRKEFEGGTMSKLDYSFAMQKEHARLAEYGRYLQSTDISSITISDDGVVMTSRRHGVRIACDPTDRGIPPIVALNLRAYEARDGGLLLSLVDDGMTFLDVGANIGWYALHVGKMFPRSRVFAFEPVAESFQYLSRSIALNGLGNVRAFPYGLFDEPGSRTFHVDPDIKGAASSSKAAAGSVPCVGEVDTLDRVVQRLGIGVDFIKADVEGAELFVLKGGLKSIEATKPVLFLELLRKHAATFAYHPNEVIKLLADMGYRCFTAGAGGMVEFFTMDEQTVETNFVFLHSDRHEAKIGRHCSPGGTVAAPK